MFYPLKLFSKWLTYRVFSIEENSLLGNSLEFFIFDILKIFILIFVLIFIVSFIRSYISKERIQKFLSNEKKYFAHFLAAVLGIITPFCTCSAIPLFLSFLEMGIPIGITFSFLIASPMINEVAIILLIGTFGVKIALIYILSGLIISIIAGIILGKINSDKWVLKDMLIKNYSSACSCNNLNNVKQRISFSKKYTLSTVKKIWPYIIIGVGIGAWIHGYLPSDFLEKYANSTKWYDIPLAVLLGIPLYSNAAGAIPLISSLAEKGLSIGTSLAFLMSLTGLSLPEFIILKRIFKWRLILIFATIVAIGILLTGYLFNFLV